MASGAMPVPVMKPGGGMKSNLYAGNTNSTGMNMPVGAGSSTGLTPGRGFKPNYPMPVAEGIGAGNNFTPSYPSPAPVSTSTFSPQQAPNMLTSSPTPGSAPPTGAPGTATGTMSGLSSTEASRVLGENQNYYGQGMGALLTNYLQTGAGYSGPMAQQTISSTDAAMQQQINQQYGNLQSSMASAGLSPDSSGFQLGQSEFLSNASAQENQVAAQQYLDMYNSSQARYEQAMLSMAGVNAYGTANQQTGWGAFSSLMTGGIAGMAGYLGGGAGMAGAYVPQGGILSGGGQAAMAGGLI